MVISGNGSASLRKGRIAFFHPYFNDGGIERGMAILSRKFGERGVSTDILTFRHTGKFLQGLPDTCRILDLGAKRALYSILPLARYLREWKPDCLISAQSYANVMAIMANLLSGRKTRLMVTERVAISMERGKYAERMGFGGIKDKALLSLMKALYPMSDVIAANSGDGAAELRGILKGAEVHVLHNPTFDADLLDKSRDAVEHPWLNPKDVPLIISVGRLSPQKDYPTLLRAFARVRSARPCRLVILGEGEERDRLESLARELGIAADVDLPGFQRNPHAWVSRADLFVLSSLYEGLPNALIEAVAVGTPCIAMDCLSGPREILLDGRGGSLVPVGDEARLAEAMCGYLDDPRKARDMLGVARSGLARFESNAVADRYLEFCLSERGAMA